MKKILRLTAVLVAALSLIAASACGDDDEAADGTTTTTTTTTSTDDTAGEGEGDGGPEEGPPEENPCAEGASGDMGPPQEEPADDATAVTVTGSDYAFDGVEEMADVGEYALTFTNDGEELHELVVARIADGETRSLEELVELPDEEAMEVIEMVAFAFACPGDSSDPVGVNIEEPGRYVAICFIPVGATPETDPAEFEEMETPHFMNGMVEEFTVES